VVVTLLLLILLWRQLEPGTLIQMLGGASPEWIAVGLVLYVGVNLVRALRFRLLIPSRPLALIALLPVSFAVSLLNNILPLRGGEVSFVVLTRWRHDVPAADGTAALGVARLFDFLAVAVWFVPLAWLSLNRLPGVADWPVHGTPTAVLLAGAAGLVLLGALAIGSLAWFGRRAIEGLRWTVERVRCGDWPPALRALAFARRAAGAFEALRDRRTYGGALALSLVSWLGTFAWLYAFTRALGQQVGFGLFIVGVTFAVLSKALPTPTLGGHGVSETGWTLGFTLVGWPLDEAIASGLGVSALNLVAVALFGLPALAWLRWAPGRVAPS
jgi:uncharacterized membrane protein YbhN (UPF0104 family)